MIKEIELVNSLKKLNKTQNIILPGKVISINKDNLTCKVELSNDIYIDNVRIQALEKKSDGLVIIPKINSYVLIAKILDSNQFIIIGYTEIEEINTKISNTEYINNQSGIQIKYNDTKIGISELINIETKNESLLNLFSDLLDAITQITVPTGTGPSGTPINAAVFSQIKQRLNNLLN